MTRWIAISRADHLQAHYRPRQGFQHTAHKQQVPVLVSELPKLMPHYVLAFIKNDRNFTPVALLGLGDGPNLYLNADGCWLADYVPANLRGFPFILARDASDQHLFAIHEEHLVADGKEGQPLMTEAGQLRPEVQHYGTFLQHCANDRARTEQAVDALVAEDLIVPWSLKVKLAADADPVELQGFYGIDEQRLDALPGKRYARLQGPAMTLAYAQRFSRSNLEQISRRALYQSSLMAAQTDPALADDIGTLFGEFNDDLLFNFD